MVSLGREGEIDLQVEWVGGDENRRAHVREGEAEGGNTGNDDWNKWALRGQCGNLV